RDNFTEANALREELAALRERDKLKDTLLENYVAQMADLKEDRDKWRQQATNLLANQEAEPVAPASVKRRRWWPF
ncbi:hypothetical protein QVM29_32090, partial [Pseudomonas aeruginosa]|uniref:hypothetical protein n=2 Tax=Pseudomonadota TaxID=1224 RepID=UPI00352363AD